MKYVIAIIGAFILIGFYNSYNEKKAKELKNKLTCIEFLNANSIECLDSPISYVRKTAKLKAKEEIKNFKKDLESLEIELEKFFSEAKINESEYRIISWAEINYIDLMLLEQKNKKIDLYDEKIVARGKIGGCFSLNKEKYFFCTDSSRYEDSETRENIIIDNIDSLTGLKEIYEDFVRLGLKKKGFLFPYPKDIYDLQLYGKIRKISGLTNRMEVHSIKFIKRLVSEKTILRLLEGKIFNSDWKKVKEFQTSRSL